MNTDTRRLFGPKKANVWPDKGLTRGDRGWGPIEALVADGTRRVKRIVDWVGGEGQKPPVGMYVCGTGYTTNIADATDVRGAAGLQCWWMHLRRHRHRPLTTRRLRPRPPAKTTPSTPCKCCLPPARQPALALDRGGKEHADRGAISSVYHSHRIR